MYHLRPNLVGGGHAKITIADTVISLFADYLTLIKPTSGIFAGRHAYEIYISPVISGVYITLDGTDPATDGSTGHPLEAGDFFIIEGWEQIKLLKFIRQGSTSGAIVVTPRFTTVGLLVPDPE